jgi:soluble lytic murein transglycosylase-like protein
MIYIIAALLLLFGSQIYASTKSSNVTPSIPYENLFNRYSSIYLVSKRLMVSVVKVESRFNPNAINEEVAADKRKGRNVSSIGLCQILYPDTAIAFEPGITREALFNPDKNLDRVMAEKLKQYGGNEVVFAARAVAAYNAGSPRFKSNGEFVNQSYVNKVRKEWDSYEYLG